MSESSVDSSPPGRTGLARERTSWAAERTLFAADRTLIAWVRTSISLISFGFTFVKFFEYLAKSVRSPTALHLRGPRNIGIALVAVGTAAQLFTALQSLRLRKMLGPPPEGEEWPRLPGTIFLAFAVFAVGVAALLLLLFPSGVF